MKLLFVVATALIVPAFIHSFPNFQARIPNGANVLMPDGTPWPEVGHLQTGGVGGPRNPFGLAFKEAGLVWTRALCEMDSDGDGKTNGEELGDPWCEWVAGGAAPSRTYDITHPGFFDDFEGVDAVNPAAAGGVQDLSLPSWLQIHITCMMLSWGILLPLGAIIAISFRGSFTDKGKWFQIHKACQSFGILLMLTGFIVAFLNVAKHFNTSHNVLGFFVSIFGLLQGLQGVCRPHKPESGEETPLLRRVWELYHKSMGRIVLLLAWTNIFLGARLINKRFSGLNGNGRVLGFAYMIFGLQGLIAIVLTGLAIFYRSTPPAATAEEEAEKIVAIEPEESTA